MAISYDAADAQAWPQSETDAQDGTPQTSALVTWTSVTGALVSLSLIAGVGIWGYDLMMRDVSGIPVVRATTTEMRVRPDDPGGQLAQHMGLAVNEVAANGIASGDVESVRLAPPAVALAEEDLPVASLTGEDDLPAGRMAEDETPAELLRPEAPADASDAPELAEEEAINRVVAQLMAGAGEGSGAPNAQTVEPVELASASGVEAGVALLDEPLLTDDTGRSGLQLSMRPRLRPKASDLKLASTERQIPVQSAPIDPDAIPSGTRLAQLGAFDSADIARAEWGRMQGRFGEILRGKSWVVQEAQMSGRTFFRLRAMGFRGLDDTRRFCSAMKAEGVDCIPVQVK